MMVSPAVWFVPGIGYCQRSAVSSLMTSALMAQAMGFIQYSLGGKRKRARQHGGEAGGRRGAAVTHAWEHHSGCGEQRSAGQQQGEAHQTM